MRKILNLAAVLSLATVSIPAQAAEQVLNCSIGEGDGTAQIKILLVEGHPEIQVFDLEMKVMPVRSNGQGDFAELAGLLTTQIGPDGLVFASGLIMTQSNSATIINPELITLQGSKQSDGTYLLSLYDEDRVLQHGFGTRFECR